VGQAGGGRNSGPKQNIVDPLHYLTEELRAMLAAGSDQPIENLIANHSYLVLLIGRRHREVFALLEKDFLDDLTHIRLPQRLHEPFEQLFVLARFNEVNSFFIRFTGNVNNGKPTFTANGRGFSTYV